MTTRYDTIGVGYAAHRRPDPRIAALLHRELAEATDVVNVGAGVGSYEPTDRPVVAVEPSAVMVAQRPQSGPPVVQARAEALPFADGAFDVATALLTLHHWSDVAAGLRELRRVARRRVVLFTWVGLVTPFWLLDYLPAIRTIDEPLFPTIDALARVLGPLRVAPVPIPHDCTDGFLAAYWRRPERYLDAGVRGAISTFDRIDAGAGLRRLADDLASGAWQRRYADVLARDAMDLGYRVVVA